MRVPTTDEMDSTTPEERYKLVAICAKCGEPHYFTGSRERSSQTDGEVCKCGSKQFVGGSLISQRTFNPLTYKRKARTSRR